jgi:hypothetical protein
LIFSEITVAYVLRNAEKDLGDCSLGLGRLILKYVFHCSSEELFLLDKEVSMARRHEKTMARRIFENILFLEEVFGDKADADIPDVPILELAKSFDLSPLKTLHANRGRGKSSQRGNTAGELQTGLRYRHRPLRQAKGRAAKSSEGSGKWFGRADGYSLAGGYR